MKALRTRLERIENNVDDLRPIMLAFIISKNEVRYGRQTMTLEEYERDVLPGHRAAEERYFNRTGERPIMAVVLGLDESD